MFNCDHCDDTGSRLEEDPFFYHEIPCDCAAGDRVVAKGHLIAVGVLVGVMTLTGITLGTFILIHKLVFG